MSTVVKAYNRGREDVKILKEALKQTRSVLTSKQSGLKKLWLAKIEAEESLRILKVVEYVKVHKKSRSNKFTTEIYIPFVQDAPMKIKKYIQQRKYMSAVLTLNKSMRNMFSEVR
jgi:hypothetical protein